MLANSGDPDHMQHCAASDQGRHCLSMSYKKDARITPRRCLFIVCFVISQPVYAINKDPDQSTHVRWLNWALVSSMYLRTINGDPAQSTHVRWLNWPLVSSMYLRSINEDPDQSTPVPRPTGP